MSSPCDALPGAVHFDIHERSESLRLLVEGEELCRTGSRLIVNVAGLLLLAFVGPRSAAPAWSGADAARLAFARRCAAASSVSAEGCIDALTAVAHCGAHTDCLRGRMWLARHIGADEPVAWEGVLPAEAGGRVVDFVGMNAAESSRGPGASAAPEDPLRSRPVPGSTSAEQVARSFVGHALSQHGGGGDARVPAGLPNVSLPAPVTEGFRLRDPEHEEQMRAAVAKARAAGAAAVA